MTKVTDEQIIEACQEATYMYEAAAALKVHFNTFKRRALKLGVYDPNPDCGVGRSKPSQRKIPLDDILTGKHPSYPTSHLRRRMIGEGKIEEVCSGCGIGNTWNDKPITLELDHVDGDRTNHKRKNLRLLCPNCHSQTPTYKSKNR